MNSYGSALNHSESNQDRLFTERFVMFYDETTLEDNK